jgi:hypothetical protein
VSIGNDFVAGICLIVLAATAGRHGDHDAALDAMQRCIPLWHGTGNRPQFWTAIRNLVEILHQLGEDDEACTLHAACEAAAGQAPEIFGPLGQHYLDVIDAVTAGLDDDVIADAARKGSALGYHDTAHHAIDVVGSLRSARDDHVAT